MASCNLIRSFKPAKVFIGNAASARPEFVEKKGFTHVVHCVSFRMMYKYKRKVRKCSIKVDDLRKARIGIHFKKVFKFMNEACKNSGSRILVHWYFKTKFEFSYNLSYNFCYKSGAGRSRSSTMAIAFIMHHQKRGFNEVLKEVKKYRKIASPNIGFVAQLRLLETHNFEITDELEKVYESYKYEDQRSDLMKRLKKE